VTYELRIERVDRVRPLDLDSTKYIAEQGRGFDRREDRDNIEGGWPSILDALEDLAAGRIAT
jgi:hypothetical protein